MHHMGSRCAQTPWAAVAPKGRTVEKKKEISVTKGERSRRRYQKAHMEGSLSLHKQLA